MINRIASLAILCACTLAVSAQVTDKVAEVLDVYRRTALPFLDKISKKDFNTTKTNPSTLARMREFREIIDDSIKVKVIAACKAQLIRHDVDSIANVTENSYRQQLKPVTLPAEFYSKAKDEALKHLH